MSDDERWMARCLELAERAWGRTTPNPLVGSVIVRDGQVVGEGFHPRAGDPHAEVFALHAAGDAARGATLYVNLEPCNHHGRTPPCSEAIVAAGLGRVVVGTIDPNPKVAGGGIARLRDAGIAVTVGVLEERCRQLNEAFAFFITHHRPFGMLKWAMTLDGKIAAHTGHSRWVTGEAARTLVHRLRAYADAVVVGGGTLRADDPELTVRLVEGRQPLRVVLSRQLVLPADARLWRNQDVARTLVFSGPQADPAMRSRLEKLGVEVRLLPELNPDAVNAELATLPCVSVLWECGGALAWSALDYGVIQKIYCFISPKIVGGSTAPSPVGGPGFARMDEALKLTPLDIQPVGEDWLLTGYLPVTNS